MAEENQLHIEDLIYWVNQTRLNPQILVPFLENHLQNFRNQNQIEISPHSFYQTFEGKKAWHQAIQFLNNQTPINPLVRHSGLNKSSNDHSADLAANNATGQIGSDGSTLSSRVKRYCKLEQCAIGQTVAEQFKKKVRNHARETVLSLIVCDGDESRTDRSQIFNDNYRYFGVSVNQSESRYVTVINYSSRNLVEVSGNVLGDKTNISLAQGLKIKKTESVLFTDSENNSIHPINRQPLNNPSLQIQRIY